MVKCKIAVLIPTRGNRENFLEFSMKRLKLQSLQPDEIILVNDPPVNNKIDVTWRYRLGLERASNLNCDLVFFWEDDDWYSSDYLSWMYTNWETNGRPAMFGIDETYYHHIKIHKNKYMKHHNRSSAFCMAVTTKILQYKWPSNDYPYFDLHMWKNYKGVAIPFGDRIRAIGIKHGIGMVGGGGHNVNFKWTNNNALKWFINIIDEESLNFYNSIKWK